MGRDIFVNARDFVVERRCTKCVIPVSRDERPSGCGKDDPATGPALKNWTISMNRWECDRVYGYKYTEVAKSNMKRTNHLDLDPTKLRNDFGSTTTDK